MVLFVWDYLRSNNSCFVYFLLSAVGTNLLKSTGNPKRPFISTTHLLIAQEFISTVAVNGHLSDANKINAGVPQGLYLPPDFVFSIYKSCWLSIYSYTECTIYPYL